MLGTIRERVLPYRQSDLDRWKDHTASWIEFIPEPSRPFALDRYRGQAGDGTHFGEMLQIRELYEAGLFWQYEDYSLFDPPPRDPTANNAIGHAVLVQAYGASLIAELKDVGDAKRRERGDRRQDWPKMPDLFAYWRIDDTVFPARFVEVKMGSGRPTPGQLLGLAIIRKVLRTPVEIIYYVPEGSHPTPRKFTLPDV